MTTKPLRTPPIFVGEQPPRTATRGHRRTSVITREAASYAILAVDDHFAVVPYTSSGVPVHLHPLGMGRHRTIEEARRAIEHYESLRHRTGDD